MPRSRQKAEKGASYGGSDPNAGDENEAKGSAQEEQNAWDPREFSATFAEKVEEKNAEAAAYLKQKKELTEFSPEERRKLNEDVVATFKETSFNNDDERRSGAYEIAKDLVKDGYSYLTVDQAVAKNWISENDAKQLKQESIKDLYYRPNSENTPAQFHFEAQSQQSLERLTESSKSFSSDTKMMSYQHDIAEALAASHRSEKDAQAAIDRIDKILEDLVTDDGSYKVKKNEKLDFDSMLEDTSDAEKKKKVEDYVALIVVDTKDMTSEYASEKKDQRAETFVATATCQAENDMLRLVQDTSLTDEQKKEKLAETEAHLEASLKAAKEACSHETGVLQWEDPDDMVDPPELPEELLDAKQGEGHQLHHKFREFAADALQYMHDISGMVDPVTHKVSEKGIQDLKELIDSVDTSDPAGFVIGYNTERQQEMATEIKALMSSFEAKAGAPDPQAHQSQQVLAGVP